MEIGAGITIGGGITLEVPSGGGGGGTPDVSGNATIALSGVTSNYGSADDSSGGYGVLTATPAAIKYLIYSVTGSETWLMFKQGTFGGLTINTTDVNGHTSTNMTCNGATASSTGAPGSVGPYLRFVFTGDPFGLASADGTTLPYSVTLT